MPRQMGVTLKRFLPVILAALLLIAGVGVMMVSHQAMSFGWFAYAPLSQQTYFPGAGMIILAPGELWGMGMVVAGLIMLAFWSGYRTARRNRG